MVFFFLLKSKETCTDQSIRFKFFDLPNLNDSQTFKSSSSKKFFLQCVCYRNNLSVFCSCDNWKTLFFLKVCCYCKIFSTPILSFSLRQMFLKKSIFSIISTITLQRILMLSSKIKLSFSILT